MSICAMAALAFLTAAAALAASPTLPAAVPELPVVYSGDKRISAAVLAERIEADVTALEMELSVNILMLLAGGGLARRVSGVLFLLPPAAAVPGAAEGTGGRAAVEQEALGVVLDVGVGARRRGGGCNGPAMVARGDDSGDAAAAEGAADCHDGARDATGLCPNGSADDSVGFDSSHGCPPSPIGPASVEPGV